MLPNMMPGQDTDVILTDSTFSNPTDPAKQITSHVADVLDPVINNTRVVTVTSVGDVPNTFTATSGGSCDNADGNNYSAFEPIAEIGGTDVYGLPYPGSLGIGDLVRLMDTGPDPGNSVGMGKQGPRGPQAFVGRESEGPGIEMDLWGTKPIPDPNNPGQALDNPSHTADGKVKGFIVGARPERFKRTAFYPLKGILFDPQIPPLAPPTIAQSVDNSSTLGDNAQRRWGLTWSDGTHESEMGPLSDWALGYLRADVTIPAVPTIDRFSAITAVNLWRNTAADPDTFQLHSSQGITGATVTDTTPDASLGAAYDTTIKTGIGPNVTELKTMGIGGGASGPGAANYGINVGDNVDHLGNYIPWDHIITGADVYLDPTNTDGLTIPADGGGDYELTTTVAIDAHSGPTISNWSVEYWLSIELWRSGTQVLHLEKQDMYQDAPTDEQFWGHFKVDITAAVPGTQPGDVIKTHLATATSGFAGDPDGAIQVEADDVHTWVSIIPVGHGSATTVPTIQFDNTSGAATPDFGVDDIMHWDVPTVDPQLDTSGGTIAALDPVNDTLIDILQDGTYHIQGQLEGFLSGDGSSGNWQLEIDLYINGALYGSASAVPNAVCLPVTPTFLSGVQTVTFPFAFDVQLRSGDTLSMPLSGPMPAGWSGNVGSSFTWLTISKVG